MSDKDFDREARAQATTVFASTAAADRLIKTAPAAWIRLANTAPGAAIGQTRALAPPVFIGGFRTYTVVRKRTGEGRES